MKRHFGCLILFGLIFGSASPAWTAPAPEEPFLVFYNVREDAQAVRAGFSSPQEFFLKNSNPAWLSLLNWAFNNRPLGTPSVPYDRKGHFGEWVDDPRDNNCLNTRAKVLIRDSKRPVQMSRSNRCVVDTGEWHEPYVGLVTKSSRDIQIDHVVALKNTYISGGWRWHPTARCIYANWMENNFHLLSTEARSNMSKGDKTPADWMPQRQAYHCEYLKIWLQIKLIWGLAMHDREARAIQHWISQNRCDPQQFVFSVNELADQRRRINASAGLCANFRGLP